MHVALAAYGPYSPIVQMDEKASQPMRGLFYLGFVKVKDELIGI